jgi:hypothetical protein
MIVPCTPGTTPKRRNSSRILRAMRKDSYDAYIECRKAIAERLLPSIARNPAYESLGPCGHIEEAYRQADAIMQQPEMAHPAKTA